MKEQIIKTAKKNFPFCIEIRRKIHKNPELSFNEKKTAETVFNALRKKGIKAEYCCNNTGVYALLENGLGKTIVLRADLDALPIEEKTNLPFSSVNKGVMHACGHDIHTACLIGATYSLKELCNLWKGKIVFLFQPAEETAPGGAKMMIKEGIFPKNASAVFGLHVNPKLLTGTVGIKEGNDYAGVADFRVKVIGKGGHAAKCFDTKSPIIYAAKMIDEINNFFLREYKKDSPFVVAVGSVVSGTKSNIIPDIAEFSGTIRAFSDAKINYVIEKIKNIVNKISIKNKINKKIDFIKSYPAGYNDPIICKRSKKILSLLLGSKNVINIKDPTLLSEDFAYFQKRAKGVYLHLGVKPKNLKNMADIHTSYFNPDENSIFTGIVIHTALAIELLK